MADRQPPPGGDERDERDEREVPADGAVGTTAAEGLRQYAATLRAGVAARRFRRRCGKHARLQPRVAAQHVVMSAAKKERGERAKHRDAMTRTYPRIGRLGYLAVYGTGTGIEYAALKALFATANVAPAEARALPPAITAGLALGAAFAVRVYLGGANDFVAAKRRLATWVMRLFVVGAVAVVTGVGLIGGNALAPTLLPGAAESGASIALVAGTFTLSVVGSIGFSSASFVPESATWSAASRAVRRAELRVQWLGLTQRATATSRRLAAQIRTDLATTKIVAREEAAAGLAEVYESAPTLSGAGDLVNWLRAITLDVTALDDLLDDLFQDPEGDEGDVIG